MNKEDLMVNPGTYWRHFKTKNIYLVLEIGLDASNNMHPIVIYQLAEETENDPPVWCRPLEDFISEIDKSKYPDLNIEQDYRFVKLSNEELEDFLTYEDDDWEGK